MKSGFRVTLLTSVIAVMCHVSGSFAATEAFKDEDNKASYALGVSFGDSMKNALEQQKKLGVNLDSAQIVAGVQDVFNDKRKLNEKEVKETLTALESRIQEKAKARAEKEAAENETKGAAFRKSFAAEKGVVKSDSGLLYRIEKEGKGPHPRDEDTVVVNYRGTLIDGKEFDSSYKRGEPLSFRLGDVIPGWSEGIKHLQKGGKIKMVIPPELAYKKMAVPGIPANSTLVFDVELVDLKPAQKESAGKTPAAESKKSAK